MQCNCCEIPIPDTAKRLICPSCAQALIIPSRNQIVCKLHGRRVKTDELEVSSG